MAITRLSLDGYGARRAGSFSGKTPGAPSGPHPVGEITRLSLDGYGAKRTGSFSGRAGSSSGPHPVGVITRLSLDGYGARRAGSFAGKNQSPDTDDIELLGGKAYRAKQSYAYHTPYQKIKKATQEASEIKEAVDHAELERKELEAKLAKALKSKAKKQAETQIRLEQRLSQLENETLRLYAQLQILEALISEWDEEDALLALAMSMPFTKIY